MTTAHPPHAAGGGGDGGGGGGGGGGFGHGGGRFMGNAGKRPSMDSIGSANSFDEVDLAGEGGKGGRGEHGRRNFDDFNYDSSDDDDGEGEDEEDERGGNDGGERGGETGAGSSTASSTPTPPASTTTNTATTTIAAAATTDDVAASALRRRRDRAAAQRAALPSGLVDTLKLLKQAHADLVGDLARELARDGVALKAHVKVGGWVGGGGVLLALCCGRLYVDGWGNGLLHHNVHFHSSSLLTHRPLASSPSIQSTARRQTTRRHRLTDPFTRRPLPCSRRASLPRPRT
jgi:hypothetical protein